MGVDILRVCINKNCIAAQASECLVPVLPHAVAGQKGAFAGAMQEPFQRGLPILPCHLSHDTSWYLPSIARREEGKNAAEAPEGAHRSKLTIGFYFSA